MPIPLAELKKLIKESIPLDTNFGDTSGIFVRSLKNSLSPIKMKTAFGL